MISHRIARMLLHLLLPRDHREFILGDLDEEFEDILATTGSATAARRWYWRQSVSSILAETRGAWHRTRPGRSNQSKSRPAYVRDLSSDIRFGIRSLKRSPSFLAATTLTLTIGIGATTAIFSVSDAVLWRPLPYPDADRLAILGATFPNGGIAPVSPPLFFDWQRENAVFDAIAGVYRHRFNLTGRAEPLALEAAGVSAEFAEVFGLQVTQGRWFTVEEDEPTAGRVVVLSHSAWVSHWGSDPNVVGTTLALDDVPYTVVGITPPDFHPPERFNLPATQLWFPMAFIPQDLASHANWFIRVFGRLRVGQNMTTAQGSLQGLTDRLNESYPESLLSENPGVQVRSLTSETIGDARTTLLLLLGAVTFLHLIACANVANLVLARSGDRQREVALRVSLGADRWRIVRQLLTENVILALIGGSGGAILAAGAVRAFVSFNVGNWPRASEVTVDLRVLAFTLLVAVLTGLLFGLVPALRSSRLDPGQELSARSSAGLTGVASNRFRFALTIVETGLALALLIGAGLLINSFVRLNLVETGFSRDGVVVMHVSLRSHYQTKDERRQLFEGVHIRLRSLPFVLSTGFSNGLPFGGGGMMGSYVVEGTPTDTDQYTPWQLVSTGYFETLGVTPLTGGRLFNDAELQDGANTVLVNEAFAQRNWPGEPAVGRRIKVISTDPEDPWLTVVGVLPDFKQGDLSRPTMPEVYVPYSQPRFLLPWMDFIVKTSADIATVAPAMRQAVWDIDRDQPIDWQATLRERISESVDAERFYLVLLASFAAAALLLATGGIYGVVTFTVERRTRELGIRLALGSTVRRAIVLVMVQTTVVVGMGLAIGVAVATFTGRFLESFVFEVSTLDAATIAAAATVLLLCGLLAGYLPARRITRIGIADTLRVD